MGDEADREKSNRTPAHAWLAEDMTLYRGDNQDPAFIEKIRRLSSQHPDWPRRILDDDGYFNVICQASVSRQ
jgi:hypothetical protein